MPKIPDYLDYCARPSLRTGRVDQPHQGGLIIADAVSKAAGRFANVMEERKGQQDRLTYTRLKTELLKEDIRIQRELQETGNWETYEDDYRELIGVQRERIQEGITNPHDRVIFDADSGLLVERGVTSMASEHRAKYLDFEKTSMLESLNDLQYDLTVAKPYQRRDIIQAAHAMVQARVDSGIVDATEGLSLQQTWVRQAAAAELLAMDDRERVVMLERAIDANLDPNDYQGEKGTGSLADFLPQDVRIEMLRKTKVQIESEDELIAAQNTVDAAFQMYQADTAANQEARLAHVRSNLTGKERDMAESMVRERNGETARVTSQRRQEIVSTYTDRIMEAHDGESGYFSVTSIPRSEWTLLSAGEKQALTQLSLAMQQNRRNGLFDEATKRVGEDGEELPSYYMWKNMSNRERAQVDLNRADWRMAFTQKTWEGLLEQQENARAGTGLTFEDGLTNDQLLLSFLTTIAHPDTGKPWVPQTGRDYQEQEYYARARLEFDQRIQDEMRRLGVHKLDKPQKRKILVDMLGESAFLERNFAWNRGDAKQSSAMPVHMMTEEQRESAFLPLNTEEARQDTVPLDNGEVLTVEQWMIGYAMSPRESGGLGMEMPPTKKNLERAYFAWKARLGDEEVDRRLEGRRAQ